jgi:hypothetical protein
MKIISLALICMVLLATEPALAEPASTELPSDGLSGLAGSARCQDPSLDFVELALCLPPVERHARLVAIHKTSRVLAVMGFVIAAAGATATYLAATRKCPADSESGVSDRCMGPTVFAIVFDQLALYITPPALYFWVKSRSALAISTNLAERPRAEKTVGATLQVRF